MRKDRLNITAQQIGEDNRVMSHLNHDVMIDLTDPEQIADFLATFWLALTNYPVDVLVDELQTYCEEPYASFDGRRQQPLQKSEACLEHIVPVTQPFPEVKK